MWGRNFNNNMNMGGPMNMMQRFNQFCQQFQQSGKDPQQMVQELLDNGKMSQQQYDLLRNMANGILGTKY